MSPCAAWIKDEHAARLQLIRRVRGDLLELALGIRRIAELPHRLAELEARVEIPRPQPDEPREQLERGLPLALRRGRHRRRAQCGHVVGREVDRVVELRGRLARRLRIARRLPDVELAEQALRLEQLRIEKHGALEIVLGELEIRRRAEHAGQVAETAAHHEHGIDVLRERAQ